MKRTPRRSTMLLVIVTAFALLAAACGDDQSTTDVGAGPGTDPTTQPTTTTTTAPPSLPPLDPPLGAGPYPIADITVEVHAEGTGSPVISTYRLSCLGDTATVTGDAPASDQQMCLSLGRPAVRDLLVNGSPTDRMCTEIYGGPDAAVFAGTLDGETVSFTAGRSNGCAINEWDSTLADLLPAPIPFG